MKMKASAASENANERSVKYERTLPGMWSMKIRNSERPRKKSRRRSRVGRATGVAMATAAARGSGLWRGHAHQLLAAILSGEQPDEGARRRGNAIRHVLFVLDLAFAQPLRNLAAELPGLVTPVPDQEPFHARALDQELAVPTDARVGRLQPIVERDPTDDDDAAMQRQIGERRVVQDATNIVEEHVDALGRQLRELGAEGVAVFALVIDGSIEAEGLLYVSNLVGSTRRADDAAALYPCDLSSNLPDRPRCRGDQHGLAGLRLADAQERAIGGLPGHAEYAQEI